MVDDAAYCQVENILYYVQLSLLSWSWIIIGLRFFVAGRVFNNCKL